MCFVVLFYKNRNRGRKVLKAFPKHVSTRQSISLLNKVFTFIAFMENGNVLWHFYQFTVFLERVFRLINQGERRQHDTHCLFFHR